MNKATNNNDAGVERRTLAANTDKDRAALTIEERLVDKIALLPRGCVLQGRYMHAIIDRHLLVWACLRACLRETIECGQEAHLWVEVVLWLHEPAREVVAITHQCSLACLHVHVHVHAVAVAGKRRHREGCQRKNDEKGKNQSRHFFCLIYFLNL